MSDAPERILFCKGCENVSFHCSCAVDYRVEYIRKGIVDNGIKIYEIALSNKNEKFKEILKPIREILIVECLTIWGSVDYEFRYNKLIEAIKETLKRADKG